MPKMTRGQQQQLAQLAAANNIEALRAACIEHMHRIAPTTNLNSNRYDASWHNNLRLMADWLGSDSALPFQVFNLRGNSKLPFAAFSALPGVTCPGAGDCLSWCYSFKAWRFARAFCRQVQNTILLTTHAGRLAISGAWQQLPANADIRLYVDGDFPDVETLRYWMELCLTRSALNVYSYSKSWAEFLALSRDGYEFPRNYTLNLSSGSKHDSAMAAQLRAIPSSPVRGEFLAVKVGHHHIHSGAYRDKTHPGSKAYRAEILSQLREAFGPGKYFACPGNCGNCMPRGEHACGSPKMQDVTIAIGLHV